ncbi:MAG: HEPN domain-containing protein [Ruminococcus sp.]|uniref:HEPN domain-containing protein n=1 Tax=Ruminococcus sp. TaxID=41978 RepID=UPI001B2D5E34|nr:HEPN domain-containing protein [Ruminococcus sp.]MBO7474279.1 HEPN domain-containing protein [Ruminococcus sp.]MBP5363526.1 HEPN domain-containing protein [Ruminococcus sp.]
MDSSVIDLSKYRLDTAKGDLKAARLLFDATEFRSSVNRSYYAIFHALRAVLALDGFDSSKHSGIISYFNLNYVKTDVFSREISKIISSAYRLREKADTVINSISEYLDKKYTE